MHVHGVHKQPFRVDCPKDIMILYYDIMSQKDGKIRAVFFSAAEQTLLMGLYEEYKGVITKKGNTVCHDKQSEGDGLAKNC